MIYIYIYIHIYIYMENMFVDKYMLNKLRPPKGPRPRRSNTQRTLRSVFIISNRKN